jgi:hypothetical protein
MPAVGSATSRPAGLGNRASVEVKRPPPQAAVRPLTIPRGAERAAGGELLFLGQVHDVPGRLTPEQRELVAASQQKVLDELLKAKPRVVFAEGFSGTLQSGPKRMALEGIIRKFFRESAYVPGAPLIPEIRKLLVNEGAAYIYSILTPGVELRGASSPAVIEKDRSHEEDDHRFIYIDRESDTAAVVSEWREQHPDELAALVYGAGHRFTSGQVGSRIRKIDTLPPEVTQQERQRADADVPRVLQLLNSGSDSLHVDPKFGSALCRVMNSGMLTVEQRRAVANAVAQLTRKGYGEHLPPGLFGLLQIMVSSHLTLEEKVSFWSSIPESVDQKFCAQLAQAQESPRWLGAVRAGRESVGYAISVLEASEAVHSASGVGKLKVVRIEEDEMICTTATEVPALEEYRLAGAPEPTYAIPPRELEAMDSRGFCSVS